LKPKKKVLIVDDLMQAEMLREILLGNYPNEMEVAIFSNAGDAVEWLETNWPDVVVVELFLLYGNAAELLGKITDPGLQETGLRLIQFIHKTTEIKNKSPVPTFLVTTQRSKNVNTDDSVTRIYEKPFSTLKFEDDLCKTLGIKSKIPPELLAV